jgi:hypothetical protein
VTKLGWQWTNLSVLPLLLLMAWVARRETERPARAFAS